MAVVGAGGRVFGHVEELELETDTLRVESLHVQVTAAAVSDLGIKKPFWSHATLVVPARYIQAITDVVVLRLTIEEFAERLGTANAKS